VAFQIFGEISSRAALARAIREYDQAGRRFQRVRHPPKVFVVFWDMIAFEVGFLSMLQMPQEPMRILRREYERFIRITAANTHRE